MSITPTFGPAPGVLKENWWDFGDCAQQGQSITGKLHFVYYGPDQVPSWYRGYVYRSLDIIINVPADATEPVIAGVPPNPNRDETTKDKEKGSVGEPINVLDGAMLHEKAEFWIPSPGVPLAMTRYFNSGLAYTGSMGQCWTHSYDIFLEPTTNAVDANSNGVLQDPVTNVYMRLRLGDGENLWFLSPTNGSYIAPRRTPSWSLSEATNGGHSARSPEGNQLEFDSTGKLMQVADPWGNRVSLSYTNGCLAAVQHSAGQTIAFTNVGGRLAGAVLPGGAPSIHWSYNTNDELRMSRAVSGALSLTSTYTYAYNPAVCGAHSLTQIVNAAGHRFAYKYTNNAAGQPTTVSTGMAINATFTPIRLAVWTMDESGPTQMRVQELRRGAWITQTYYLDNTNHRVIRIDGPTGTDRKFFIHDTNGFMTATTVTNLSAQQFTRQTMQRDSWHNVTNYGFGFGQAPSNLWTQTWNTNWQKVASMRDPEGGVTEFDYTNGSVRSVRAYFASNSFAETTYGFSSNGLLAAVTNANSTWANFGHDAWGYPTTIASRGLPDTRLEHNALGQLLSITRNGSSGVARVTTFDPDPLGRLRGIVHSDGRQESFAYDSLGNLTNHVDRGGRTTVLAYAPTRKLISVSRTLFGATNQTAAIRYGYDEQFNSLNITDELGRAVEKYGLDGQDRIVAVTNLEGQVMTVTNGVGSFVRSLARFDDTAVAFAYNGDGGLRSVGYPDATNSYDYLRNGLLRTASNALGVVSNAYDLAGRQTYSGGTAPGGTVAYSHYPAGQVSNVVSVAGTITYGLDSADRPATIDSPQGAFGFGYHPGSGLPATSAFPNGVWAEYRFDVMDRATNIVWRDASNRVLRSFGYAFDSADRIARVNVESGDRVEYSYDSLDRLTAERRVAADSRVLRDDGYSYDLAGNRFAKTAGVVRLSYSLGQGNRLAGWSVANGPVTAKVDVAGYSTEAIGLDEWWGRLWVETGTRIKPTVSGTNFTARDLPVVPGATQTVVAAIRDGAGNMGYATNRLFVGAATNAVYGYNAAGCVTGMTFGGVGFSRSVSLAWNGQYQLTGLAVDGTNVEAAAYDAMGRRAMIIANGATNRLVYDGEQVIAEVDATGSLTRSYVWGPGIDNLLGFTTYSGAATNKYYCLTDHLGTVHAIVDQSGAVVESYQFDAWGRVAGVFDGAGAPLSESALGNRYLWQGREYSWATGLYHFRARWYDPITGRWLSNDPIGISGGLNQYVFCANNPVNLRDPLGFCEGDDATPAIPIVPIPGTVIGSQNLGRMPPQPPGYNPRTWPRTVTDAGPGLKNPDGRYWFPHREDPGHWRHWDIEDWSKPGGGPKIRWPENSIKPWPTQKRGLNPNQSWNDPSGDAPPFEMPMSPGMAGSGMMPFMVTPAPGLSPAAITLPTFNLNFGPVFAPALP